MLKINIIIALSSLLVSCAAFPAGKKCPCDLLPPERPEKEFCIIDENGSAFCFDPRRATPRYVRPTISGLYCTNKNDYLTEENWIKSVLNIFE